MSKTNLTANTTVFVGNTAPGTSYTAGSITEGTVAVIDEYGTVITSALSSTSNRVRVITKKDGVMKYSPFFSYANIITKTKQAYSAPVEQTLYVGYNGTSGSFDGSASPSITASKTYVLTLELTNFDQYSKSPFVVDVPVYTTSTSQLTLFSAFQKGVIAKMNQYAKGNTYRPILCNKVCAGTDGGNTAGTWSISVGSRYATVSSASGLSVGDVIRTCATGGAATYPVYSIVSISGTTIELDNEYQASADAATATWCEVTTPTNYGLKFEGVAVSTMDLDDQLAQVTFRAYISDKTAYVPVAATQTNTAASAGSGNWKWVKSLELAHWYGHGQSHRSALPLENPVYEASSDKTYDCIYIKAKDTTAIDKGQIGTAKDATFDIYIFTDSAILYNDTDGYSLGTIFTV